MDLVIVMPVYNESGCIEAVTLDWLKIFDRLDGRLIAINDGSKDNTGEILNCVAEKESRLLVYHQQNAGHGAAILTGYAKAIEFNPAYVFQTDGDNQIKPGEFWKLWEQRKQASFILGARVERADAPHRLVLMHILKGIILFLFGINIRDANAPFRLMRITFLKDALRQFPSNVSTPNIFLSLVAARYHGGMVEVPVQHFRRSSGTGSLNLRKLVRVCFRSAKELLQFRLGQAGACSTRVREIGRDS
jgi:dolichol-phosphate mannosyltransferase